jgi:hypothetical protein
MELFKFIKASLTKGSPESSKRLFGAIGFISSIVFIAIWEHGMINELLYVSSALIGLGILDRFKK